MKEDDSIERLFQSRWRSVLAIVYVIELEENDGVSSVLVEEKVA